GRADRRVLRPDDDAGRARLEARRARDVGEAGRQGVLDLGDRQAATGDVAHVEGVLDRLARQDSGRAYLGSDGEIGRRGRCRRGRRRGWRAGRRRGWPRGGRRGRRGRGCWRRSGRRGTGWSRGGRDSRCCGGGRRRTANRECQRVDVVVRREVWLLRGNLDNVGDTRAGNHGACHLSRDRDRAAFQVLHCPQIEGEHIPHDARTRRGGRRAVTTRTSGQGGASERQSGRKRIGDGDVVSVRVPIRPTASISVIENETDRRIGRRGQAPKHSLGYRFVDERRRDLECGRGIVVGRVDIRLVRTDSGRKGQGGANRNGRIELESAKD